WWNGVLADDLDGDGDVDLAAGNLGLNSRVRVRPGEPARLYLADYDGSGRTVAVLATYRDGREYPFASLDLLRQQFPSVRKRYASYADFGARGVGEVFEPGVRWDSAVHEAETFATVWAENDGAGRFTVRALPAEAQFAPVYALLARDFDGDGRRDLLLAGNFTGVRPDRGREDASYGLLLRQSAPGQFEAADLTESGLGIEGEVRALAPLRRADGARVLLVARNDDAPVVLRPREQEAVAPAAAQAE
ncbi:MAG: hypothetical protein R3362_08970, partial [Rhodothermales bacterium]|nr:hypothetical protein [Rhodothermales bacterium]